MRVLVDADACPVTKLAIALCEENNIEIHIFFDHSHLIESDYASCHICDKGRDSVDMELISKLNKNDVVITQDYGLACLALAKGCFAINQNGMIYSNSNIDNLLFTRALGQKIRNSGGRTKGPSKRSAGDDENFVKSFTKIINDLDI